MALEREAEEHFQEAFRTLSDSEYLKTIEKLQELMLTYSGNPRIQDAYFYIADIYHARLQGNANFHLAIQVLEDFRRIYPDSAKSLDAQITIAVIYYRNLNDPDAAIRALETYFDILSYHDYTEGEKLQAQLLHTKFYQKKGHYFKEKALWDGLLITSPDVDRVGRHKFLNDLENWKRLTGSGLKVFFHNPLPPEDYQLVLTTAQEQLTRLEGLFNESLPADIEIYLYRDKADLLDHTDTDEPQVFVDDREIHLTPGQIDWLPFAVTSNFALALNNRVSRDLHPLTRQGMNMFSYQNKAGADVHYLAAELLQLFDRPPQATLFLRESTFHGTQEYDYLAGSFCSYLIDNEPVEKFLRIYKGLYPNPRHDSGMVEQIFNSIYGKPMDRLVSDWYTFLAPQIAQVRSELERFSYDLDSYGIDLSTPESSLKTWYEGLRRGDFKALIASSTPDLADMLRDAQETYEKEGIMKEVRVGQFIYPYYPTTYRVVNIGELGDELRIIQIEILKENVVIKEENIPVKRIKGKWYVDVNP